MEIFTGANLQEHVLYLGHNDLFNIQSDTKIELKIDLERAAKEIEKNEIIWEYWNGENWLSMLVDDIINDPEIATFQKSGVLILKKQCIGEISEYKLENIKSRWIRCIILSPIKPEQASNLPLIDTIKARIFGSVDTPDLAYSENIPVDLNLNVVTDETIAKMVAIQIQKELNFEPDPPESNEYPKAGDTSARLNDTSELLEDDLLSFWNRDPDIEPEKRVITDITESGLSGPIKEAGFYNAPEGDPGELKRLLTNDFNDIGVAQGTWIDMTPNLIVELLANKIYVNIHTDKYPDGEIRGQLLLNNPLDFSATLSGDQLEPPSGSTATGNGTFSLNISSMELTFDVNVSGLSGDITKACFYNTQSSEELHDFTGAFDDQGVAKGTWMNLNANLIVALLAGNIYVYIYTAHYTDGEIAGPITLDNPVTFKANLNADQEVHSVESDATGTGEFSLNEEANGLTFDIKINDYDNETGKIFRIFWEEGLDNDYDGDSEIRLLTAIRKPDDKTFAVQIEAGMTEKFSKDNMIYLERITSNMYSQDVPNTAIIQEIIHSENKLVLFRDGEFPNPYYEDDELIIGESANRKNQKIHVFDDVGTYIGTCPGFRGICDSLAVDIQDYLYVGFHANEKCGLAVLKSEQTYIQQGKYYSNVFDSTIQDCQWHRLVLDTEIPPKTRLEISYFISNELKTIEEIRTLPQTRWYDAIVSPEDALFQTGSGRYLWLKILFCGDEHHTPLIRQLTVYFPRLSYLRYLPAIYQEDEISRNFLERFLAIFETFFLETEETISAITRYIDPFATNSEFIPWLASWLAIIADENWEEQHIRQFISCAYNIFKKRGKREGIENIIELYTGTRPVIIEHYNHLFPMIMGQRSVIGLHTVPGKKPKKSLKLKVSSTVSEFALRENEPGPEEPFEYYAYDFTVVVNPTQLKTEARINSLKRIIEEEKPAHTKCFLRLASTGMKIGYDSFIEVSTIVAGESFPMHLGLQSILGRKTILRSKQCINGKIGIFSQIDINTSLN